MSFEIAVRMRTVRRRFAAVLLTLGCWQAGVGQQTQGERIPEVHGTSLAGDTVNLPADLHGRIGVLVIGFGKGARIPATIWAKRLATEFRDSNDVVSYELPMLAGVPGFLRGMVVRSMKSDVSEHGQHSFVPLTTDEDRWRSLTHYREPNAAYLLIVDGSGRVRWQTEGEPTDEAYRAVVEKIGSLKGGGAR